MDMAETAGVGDDRARVRTALGTTGYDPTGDEPMGLLTDLYEITMAEGFWRTGRLDTQACFTSFFRENPFGGGYTLVCGTAQVAEMVERFRYSREDVEYLRTLSAPGGGPLFSGEFLDWLVDWRPTMDIDAIQEGELAFPREPLVRVTGPIIDCVLIEAPLLNLVNFQSLVATKTARVCLAAGGRGVAEFGLRRAQGVDGGMSVARASYVGGCSSTSNVLAGRHYGIPVSGTHAHSWVMAFPDELSAFRAYAEVSPNNCTLLVDTYDAIEGVRNAITVGKEMEARGQRLAGIRIDSGDLASLSRRARAMLDEAGLNYVKIVLSNDLDENLIESLIGQGAQVDAFGVGTKLATCAPQPYLAGVYKMCAKRLPGQDWQPIMKMSEQVYKRTIPGVQDVRRFYDGQGSPVADMICSQDFPSDVAARIVDPLDSMLTFDLPAAGGRSLLRPLVRHGHGVEGFFDGVEGSRQRARASLGSLDCAYRRLLNPNVYPVGIEQSLSELRQRMISEVRGSAATPTWR
ncbi:MAG: nicotinate phosphoribosyltransferase [Coriobacteriales bacterium]|jgi:nicotinate phosphoribosyltransferase